MDSEKRSFDPRTTSITSEDRLHVRHETFGSTRDLDTLSYLGFVSQGDSYGTRMVQHHHTTTRLRRFFFLDGAPFVSSPHMIKSPVGCLVREHHSHFDLLLFRVQHSLLDQEDPSRISCPSWLTPQFALPGAPYTRSLPKLVQASTFNNSVFKPHPWSPSRAPELSLLRSISPDSPGNPLCCTAWTQPETK